jgi:hypothetical protein
VTFRNAVEQTPELQGAWRAGLGALLGAHHGCVVAEGRLTGSVNVDTALAPNHPGDSRVDYAVGHHPTNGRGETVYWIEIHPASSGHIDGILAKFRSLQHWLETSAPRLDEMDRVLVWVSTGRTAFNARSTQAKRLADAGVRNVGRVLRIRAAA